jgi:hypothetical protein
VKTIMADNAKEPIYGSLSAITEIEFPDEVTATTQRWDSEKEEGVPVTGERGAKTALASAFYQLHRSGSKRRAGRKSEADRINDPVAQVMPFAEAVMNGAEVTLTIVSGSSPTEVFAPGACATFAAFMCEVGDVLGVSVIEGSGGRLEATDIEILAGRNAGQKSSNASKAEEQSVRQPADGQPPAEGEPAELDGENDGEGEHGEEPEAS